MQFNESQPVLNAQGIAKTYQEGDLVTDVFKDLNFSLNAGEKVAILGASGSGKSTLLHLIGSLLQY